MNNLIKIGLGLSLAIVYPLMIGFGYEAFFTTPKEPYEVCRNLDPNYKLPIESQKPLSRDPQTDPQYKTCWDDAQAILNTYNRNLFLVTAALGFLAITAGTLLFNEKIGPVGPGLVFGGLLTILYGTARSFGSLDKRWIFAELLAVFVGLILVTARYLQVNKKQ